MILEISIHVATIKALAVLKDEKTSETAVRVEPIQAGAAAGYQHGLGHGFGQDGRIRDHSRGQDIGLRGLTRAGVNDVMLGNAGADPVPSIAPRGGHPAAHQEDLVGVKPVVEWVFDADLPGVVTNTGSSDRDIAACADQRGSKLAEPKSSLLCRPTFGNATEVEQRGPRQGETSSDRIHVDMP